MFTQAHCPFAAYGVIQRPAIHRGTGEVGTCNLRPVEFRSLEFGAPNSASRRSASLKSALRISASRCQSCKSLNPRSESGFHALSEPEVPSSRVSLTLSAGLAPSRQRRVVKADPRSRDVVTYRARDEHLAPAG